jgi:uncharacterized protein involved in exopolysaccharide biosynthesis
MLAGAAAHRAAPPVYRASTSILVIPQRVPEEIVRSTVTAELGERINMISQQILARTRLERIIMEFNLYEDERERLIMEDVVELMRENISLHVDVPSAKGVSAASFAVGFQSTDPRTAMRVTERLASLFVVENIEDRALLADQTNQFLQGQLEEARRRLNDFERTRADQKSAGASLPADISLSLDYEVLKEEYKSLFRKNEASRLAVNLERRQIGEQFKVIDGARLPERPVSPRLGPHLAWGAVAGVTGSLVAMLLASAWHRRHERRLGAAAGRA